MLRPLSHLYVPLIRRRSGRLSEYLAPFCFKRNLHGSGHTTRKGNHIRSAHIANGLKTPTAHARVDRSPSQPGRTNLIRPALHDRPRIVIKHSHQRRRMAIGCVFGRVLKIEQRHLQLAFNSSPRAIYRAASFTFLVIHVQRGMHQYFSARAELVLALALSCYICSSQIYPRHGCGPPSRSPSTHVSRLPSPDDTALIYVCQSSHLMERSHENRKRGRGEEPQAQRLPLTYQMIMSMFMTTFPRLSAITILAAVRSVNCSQRGDEMGKVTSKNGFPSCCAGNLHIQPGPL